MIENEPEKPTIFRQTYAILRAYEASLNGQIRSAHEKVERYRQFLRGGSMLPWWLLWLYPFDRVVTWMRMVSAEAALYCFCVELRRCEIAINAVIDNDYAWPLMILESMVGHRNGHKDSDVDAQLPALIQTLRAIVSVHS